MKTWAVAIALLLLARCDGGRVGFTDAATNEVQPMLTRVEFRSEDGYRIVGNYYEGGARGVLLLHQLRKEKSTYDTLARRLQHQGYTVLAIDFRGNGESEGEVDRFTDDDFRAMLKDVEGAAHYLSAKNVSVIAVIGASIGANTALRFGDAHPEVAVVALSPGLNYHGIDVSRLMPSSRTLLVAAEEDVSSADSVRTIAKNVRGETKTLVLSGAAHGTFLLGEHPTLSEEILRWIG